MEEKRKNAQEMAQEEAKAPEESAEEESRRAVAFYYPHLFAVVYCKGIALPLFICNRHDIFSALLAKLIILR